MAKKKYTLSDITKAMKAQEWGQGTSVDANGDTKKDGTDISTMMKSAAGWTEESAMDPYKGKEVKPEDYAGTQAYLLGKVTNRQPFSFSGGGQLYDAYAKAYKREGDLAAKDTLSKLSARTGGVPSSYAATAVAAQQNQHAAALADKIPELYGMELDKYYSDAELDRADLSTLMGVKAQDLSEAGIKAGYGDYSGLEGMGIDTTKPREVDALEKALTMYETTGDFSGLAALGYGTEYLEYLRDREKKANDTEYYSTMYQLTGDPKYLYAMDPDMDISQILEDQKWEDAERRAAAGDYSGYAALGVDTSFLERQKQAQIDSFTGSGTASGGTTDSKEYTSREESAILTKLQMGANYWDDDVVEYARNVYNVEPLDLYYYIASSDDSGATGVTYYDVLLEALADKGINITVAPESTWRTQWREGWGNTYDEYLKNIAATYL